MPVSTPPESISNYNNDGEHFKHVMKWLFVPAVEKAGFESILPVARGSDIIHDHVISKLHSSDLVLCDMSNQNPNVFFEFGIRTALNKPVCLVKDDLLEKVPFDTALINYYTYSSDLRVDLVEHEVEKLAKHIEESFNQSNSSNTLWKIFGLQFYAKPPEKLEEPEKLDLLNIKIDSLVKQLNDSLIKPIEPTANTILDYYDLAKEYDDYMKKVSSETMSLLRLKYKINLCAYTKSKDKLDIQLPDGIEIPEDAKEEIKKIESKYGVKIGFHCPTKKLS